MFAASAIDHGAPIAVSIVSGTCAWPIDEAPGDRGRKHPEHEPVSRRRTPIHQIVAAKQPRTTTSQIPAAASNGSSASGRNRIASSGGYG